MSIKKMATAEIKLKKNTLKKLFFVSMVLAVAISFFINNQVFADCGGASTSIINCDDSEENGFFVILGLIVKILTVAIGVLAAIGITIVGVQYLTARDNEEQVRKAKKRLSQLVIGIILYVLLGSLANFFVPGGFFNEFYKQYVNSQGINSGEPGNNNPGDDKNPNRKPSEIIP